LSEEKKEEIIRKKKEKKRKKKKKSTSIGISGYDQMKVEPECISKLQTFEKFS